MTHLVPYLFLLGLVLIWGSSHTAIRVALDSFPPQSLTVVRLIISALTLGTYARWSGETLTVPRGDRW